MPARRQSKSIRVRRQSIQRKKKRQVGPGSAETKRINDLCPIVGIGGSAGGFEAAMELLQNLPPRTGMAFVIVQHLDPHHASRLPNLLGKMTAMPVREVAGTTTPKPNTVYVQPPNKCVIAKDGSLTLVHRTERLNVAIDHFFESLAEECGSRAIGIVLSGTGSDGTADLRAIKAAGGLTFAQTLESAKFDAVPRSAIRDWALLRYHPVKAVNIEKAPKLGRKWRDLNPRMVGEAAENLRGTNKTANATYAQGQDGFALIPIALEGTRQETKSRIRWRK